jgi:RNA polymerase sigma-70 factor (ECF subfamily)
MERSALALRSLVIVLRLVPDKRPFSGPEGGSLREITRERPKEVAPPPPGDHDGPNVKTAIGRVASIEDEILGHADSLYNLARHLTGSSSDAEDLVQETFIRALGAAAKLGDAPAVKPWLFRILRNVFYDLRRSEKHRRTDDSYDEEDLAASDDWLRGDAELDLLRGSIGAEIERAVSKLGHESRTVLLLDVEGFTETEIAGIMECPIGTVKSRLLRARTNLRKLLSHYAK